ncbi:MAG: hypothetical protein WDZ79_02430 [Candidatus Paceibacterota bacterium]
MKKHLSMFTAIAAVLVLTPAVALAQFRISTGKGGGSGDLGGVTQLVRSIGGIVNMLIPIAFALIVVAFFFGLAKYVFNADNEEARDQGKRIMVGGVIALTVAALIWGIVAFIGGQLGIGDQSTITPPGVDFSN